jgi:putative DNA primase/helicase
MVSANAGKEKASVPCHGKRWPEQGSKNKMSLDETASGRKERTNGHSSHEQLHLDTSKPPLDCVGPQQRLTEWGFRIKKAASNGCGLEVFTVACRDMSECVPAGEQFRLDVIRHFRLTAKKHLSKHDGPEIERILSEAFPDAPPFEFDCAGDQARAEIHRLAALPRFEFELQRKAAAEKFGIRPGALDAEVKAVRDKNGDSNGQGRAVQFPEVELWPQPVNGAQLLDEIVKEVRRYVVVPRGAAEIVSLWSLLTYCFDHFMHSPRLAVVSPEKGCGKTTLLDVLRHLVARPLSTANITAAAIFRLAEQSRPTLLIDEADTFLTTREDVRGILNSGHRKGDYFVRTVGDDHEPRRFSTYSPAAIAMIGRLPDTLNDRSVELSLYRRKTNEPVQLFRCDRANSLTILARKMARWAVDNAAALKDADPDMGEVQNRTADNWRPLLAIADVVGGEWPKRAREIMVAADDARSDFSNRAMLLTDIKAAFQDKQTDRLSSEDLARYLGALEDRPWAEYGRTGRPITAAAVARLLTPFLISPKSVRLPDGRNLKGYHLTAFNEVFERYLPSESVTPSQPMRRSDCDVLEGVTRSEHVTAAKASQPLSHSDCDGVTLSSPQKLDQHQADATLPSVEWQSGSQLTKGGEP